MRARAKRRQWNAKSSHWCTKQSWRDPAGASPARVKDGANPVFESWQAMDHDDAYTTRVRGAGLSHEMAMSFPLATVRPWRSISRRYREPSPLTLTPSCSSIRPIVIFAYPGQQRLRLVAPRIMVRPPRAAAWDKSGIGASPSGKAADFDSAMRRFESSRPSQCFQLLRLSPRPIASARLPQGYHKSGVRPLSLSEIKSYNIPLKTSSYPTIKCQTHRINQRLTGFLSNF